MNEALLIRADADAEIALGQVMRCLALAQAWRECGGTSAFAMRQPGAAVTARLGAERIETAPIESPAGSAADALETARQADRMRAAWVVADGYALGAEYQKTLKEAGLRLCCIDDLGGSGRYRADIVLNQNLHAARALYPNRESHTQLLLGGRYALLRREFARWQCWNRAIPPQARKLLVTLGGGDRDGVALKAIEAFGLADLPELETTVVVGSANPHLPALEAAAKSRRIAVRIDVTDRAEAMAEADLAPSSAGSTCWELAFMQLPAALIPLAENQVPLAAGMERLGVLTFKS